MFLIMVLLACQSADPPVAATQEAMMQTDASQAPPASNSTQEDLNMTPATPPNESAEAMIKLVKEHLAKKLSIVADQIVLSAVKPVRWRDAGLGCPKPGVDYIQMETPGYSIFLEAGEKTYNYHTDETKRFVLCNK